MWEDVSFQSVLRTLAALDGPASVELWGCVCACGAALVRWQTEEGTVRCEEGRRSGRGSPLLVDTPGVWVSMPLRSQSL
jgi:hypothetical protein